MPSAGRGPNFSKLVSKRQLMVFSFKVVFRAMEQIYPKKNIFPTFSVKRLQARVETDIFYRGYLTTFFFFATLTLYIEEVRYEC
jgi:hypothetical protein